MLKKQRAVALSFIKAEYRALTDTVTEVAWTKTLFVELGLNFSSLPIISCDNQSTNSLASTMVFHAHAKHIEIEAHHIRDQVSAKKVIIQYVPTELQKANILIKPLPTYKIEFLEMLCKLVLYLFARMINTSRTHLENCSCTNLKLFASLLLVSTTNYVSVVVSVPDDPYTGMLLFSAAPSVLGDVESFSPFLIFFFLFSSLFLFLKLPS